MFIFMLCRRSSLQWQLAVSDPERTLLAILQDRFIEIRHKRDDYETPIARTTSTYMIKLICVQVEILMKSIQFRLTNTQTGGN